MVLDSILSSPVRRSTSFRKQFAQNELSWSALIQRHRFLLTALALLTFLCTIYLYFAVTLGGAATCSGLSGTQKALCRLEQAKTSVTKGKMKILQHSYHMLFPTIVFFLVTYGGLKLKRKKRTRYYTRLFVAFIIIIIIFCHFVIVDGSSMAVTERIDCNAHISYLQECNLSNG